MKQTVLITGGSSGIGYALSEYFARDGYRILWVALTGDELTASAARLQIDFPGVELHFLAADLSEAVTPLQVVNWTQDNAWTVDVLVNNAGFGNAGKFEQIPWERERAMLQVNMLAVYELTRRFVPLLEAKGAGKIMNISSVASFYPMPYAGAYAGTKAFVRQFSETLRLELQHRRSPIQVTTICPGPIKETNFRAAAQMEGVRTFDNWWSATTVAEVAREAYRALNSGKHLIISGWKMRLSRVLNAILPRFIREKIIVQETIGGRSSSDKTAKTPTKNVTHTES